MNVGGVYIDAGISLQGLLAQEQQLRQVLDDLKRRMANVDALFQAGAISAQQYATSIAMLKAEAAGAAAGLKAVEQATAGLEQQLARGAGGFGGLARGAEQGTDTFRRFAQGAQQVGYAIDDVQYGLRGVANNIPGLLAPFGTFGMILGAVGISAAVAYQHWDQLVEALGVAAPKTAAEQMDELRKATDDAAEATRKLKKDVDDLDKLYEKRSKGQVARGQGVEEAIGEVGMGPLVEGVLAGELAKQPLRGLTAEENKELRQINHPKAFFEALDFRSVEAKEQDRAAKEEEVLGRRLKERRAEVEKLILRAQRGDAGALKELMPKLSPEQQKAFREASPEHKAEQAESAKGDAEDAKKRREGEALQEKQRQDREQEAKAADRERERQVKERAQALGKGELGAAILGGKPPTADEVARALEKSGETAAAAHDLAGAVLAELVGDSIKAVRDRALERGETAAQAARGLLEEHREQAGRGAAGRGRRDASEAVRAADEADPGLARRARAGVERRVLEGQSSKEAAKAVGDELTKFLEPLIGKEQATLAGAEEAEKARRGVLDDATKEMIEGPKRQKGVEVMQGGSEFIKAIQQSAGPEGDKQTQLQEKQVALLKQLVAKKEIRPIAALQ
jgi:hypothetical protein